MSGTGGHGWSGEIQGFKTVRRRGLWEGLVATQLRQATMFMKHWRRLRANGVMRIFFIDFHDESLALDSAIYFWVLRWVAPGAGVADEDFTRLYPCSWLPTVFEMVTW